MTDVRIMTFDKAVVELKDGHIDIFPSKEKYTPSCQEVFYEMMLILNQNSISIIGKKVNHILIIEEREITEKEAEMFASGSYEKRKTGLIFTKDILVLKEGWQKFKEPELVNWNFYNTSLSIIR